jgi:predicted kinase
VTPRGVYILCGLPFAGKSTLARALAHARGLAYVELDAINAERGLGLDGAAIAPETWDATYAESYRRVDESLGAGRAVIYDATNFTRAQRDRARAIAARHQVPATVLYVDVSPAVAIQRWQRNRETGQRFDVRDDDFAQVVDHFEPPTGDERVLRYEPSMPLATWVRRHFAEEGQPPGT